MGAWRGLLGMPASGVLRLRFIGIFLSYSARDPFAPCDTDRTELDIAIPINRGKMENWMSAVETERSLETSPSLLLL